MNNAKIVRNYIVENFVFGDEEYIDEETLILEKGIIDSTGILELVVFMEKKFNFQIEDEELIPENFQSVKNIANFIVNKLCDSVNTRQLTHGKM